MKKITVGILAHVDSGKTTLSEAMLYKSGNIKKLGRVDNKDAILDTHFLEKKRGITIFSKQATLNLDNTEISLLDTPGHIDFSSEMERVLSVLDYAILVISASSGIQSHTKTLLKLIKKHSIPTFVFVNKMDLISANKDRVLKSLKEEFSEGCVDFSQSAEDLNEKIALLDEDILNSYIENQTIDKLDIKKAIKQSKIYPCFFGSALKLDGVKEFLSAIDEYTVFKTSTDEFSAKIFKISRDGNTRLSFIKVISGEINLKEEINGEKINQIRVYNGEKFINVNTAKTGGVYALAGLNKSYAGQGINIQDDKEKIIQPILNYSIDILSGEDAVKVFEELKVLQDEDSSLNISWDDEIKKININLMGDVQIEILTNIIKERFNIDVEFSKGEILYKETIKETVEGVGHFEPLRHYAEVRLLLQPLERGKGIIIDSLCSEDILPRNIQHSIFNALIEIQHKGALIGAPLTDVKISLVNGRHHIKHTEVSDFKEATLRALQQALRKAKSEILEPFYEFEIEVPNENIGRLMADMQKLKAEFTLPKTVFETTILKGKGPAINLMNYNKELISYTKGLGKISLAAAGFMPCSNEEELINLIKYDYTKYTHSNPNSIFCENGKGFIVSFNDVENYAHTDMYIEKEIEVIEKDVLKSNASKYYSSFKEDKELLKIFEKTYGKIKTDRFLAFSNQNKPSTNPIDFVGYISMDEYLLVDGYNIIFAWEDLKKLAKENIDAARDKLMDILCNYQGFRQCEVVLVFDAYKVKGGQTKIEKYHNISIVYTKEAETADMYIEKTTKILSKNRKVRVATSDALQQMIILGHGALRISATSFEKEVKEIEKHIREFCI